MWPFRKKAEPRPLPSIPDIVDTTLRNHPCDCIFADGARDRIIAAAMKVNSSDRFGYEAALIDVLEQAFRAEEIYCPHEGIDRRAEFGLLPRDYMGAT